uniref:Uncharacterized protein n=1 Tax=Arundo donax TaxID=35708 RepID=A0A0A8Y1M2_ARUDO
MGWSIGSVFGALDWLPQFCSCCLWDQAHFQLQKCYYLPYNAGCFGSEFFVQEQVRSTCCV